MRRIVLQELDTLDHLLADACYRVDRKKLLLEGKVTIDATKDLHKLRTDITKDILNDDYLVELWEDQNLGIMASLLSRVTITDLDKETLVLKPDHFAVQHYKAGTLNKACDYLILTCFQNQKYALFIDLKTSIGREPNDGKLDFRGSDYDSDMVWQMIGADALLDNLTGVVYKRMTYQGGAGVRARSHFSELKQCAKTPLAKYRRRYIILYLNVASRSNATNGGVRPTSVRTPYDQCLESEVRALQVSNGQKLQFGELIACVEA